MPDRESRQEASDDTFIRAIADVKVKVPAELERKSATDCLDATVAVQKFQPGQVASMTTEFSLAASADHHYANRTALGLSPLNERASRDPLTGLLNREAFNADLAASFKALGEADQFALLCLGLDHFKAVNDTLGHPVGDKVLQTVAARLSGVTRQSDSVLRLGGDEFAIIQVGGSQPTASRILAKRIIESLGEPISIDQQTVHIGVSIGVAIAPYDAQDAAELFKYADLALDRSKTDGRGSLRYFEPSMDAQMRARRSMEIELRQALTNGEFELNYQPVMDLGTGRVVCFEALVRWNHPTRGRVPPDQFIQIAEDTRLIGPLGDWVLRQACKDAAGWPEDIRLAVNVSPVQLRDRSLVTAIHSSLAATGLKADRLELEITETALMSNTDLTIGLLQQLRTLGISIAMDDFGTGYSSISYLRKFPFDKIKIDRSFVSGEGKSDQCDALVRMIASLGISLGVKTTAEGVETLSEMDFVRAAGCSQIQGYLLSKPMPASSISALLDQIEPSGDFRSQIFHSTNFQPPGQAL